MHSHPGVWNAMTATRNNDHSFPGKGKKEILFLSFFLLVFSFLSYRILSSLHELVYNPDEGVYLQGALKIQKGEVPFRDFMHQQPPLYLYFLSLFAPQQSVTLFSPRLSSAILHILEALGIFLFLYRFQPLLACSASYFFLATPLSQFQLLALPYALMHLFLLLGVFLFVWSSQVSRFLSPLFFVLAWFAKPISLAYPLSAALLKGLAYPYRFQELLRFALLSLLSLLLGILLFVAVTHGAFLEILKTQARARVYTHSAFETWFEAAMKKVDPAASSPVGWAVREHRIVWLKTDPYHFYPWGLLLLLAGLLFAYFRPWLWGGEETLRRLRDLLSLSLLGSLLLNLLGLWGGPTWDHYQIVYLLPFAFFASVVVTSLCQLLFKEQLIGKLLFLLIPAGFAFYSLYYYPTFETRYHYNFYASLSRLPQAHKIFSLDPLIPYLRGAEPACGIYDPLNQYEPLAEVSRHSPVLSRFIVSDEQILSCLQEDRGSIIVVTYFTLLFADAVLLQYLREHPDRVYCLDDPSNRVLCQWVIQNFKSFHAYAR